MGANVDVENRLSQARFDVVFKIKALLAQRNVVEWSAAGEIILGKVWSVVRQRIIAAQHGDAALVVFPPKHFGCGEPSGPAADNDDFFGRAASSFAAWLWPRLFTLLAHPNLSGAQLDYPAGDRAQGWRCESLSRAQIKTGVMPGTPHRIADHKSFGKRPMIVRAM